MDLICQRKSEANMKRGDALYKFKLIGGISLRANCFIYEYK